jgi:hypothetical protein
MGGAGLLTIFNFSTPVSRVFFIQRLLRIFRPLSEFLYMALVPFEYPKKIEKLIRFATGF